MTSIFSRIIDHELPGHFVWEDDTAVAFLDINPRALGHTLVVPRREENRWTDLADTESDRLFWVAREIGRAQIDEFGCLRAGLVIAGYNVPHVHLHVFPSNRVSEFDFSRLGDPAEPAALAASASRIRSALARRGWGEFVP